MLCLSDMYLVDCKLWLYGKFQKHTTIKSYMHLKRYYVISKVYESCNNNVASNQSSRVIVQSCCFNLDKYQSCYVNVVSDQGFR